MLDKFNADVSVEGVQDFFLETDPKLAKAVLGMESVESWTRDQIDSVQATLQELANRIESADIDSDTLAIQTKLIILLGYISSGKAIKLLMWIDDSYPNFVGRTLAEAQMLAVLDKVNEEAARLFVERFEVLERLDMLSRIFSENRLVIIQRVLRILAGEDTTDEDEDNEYN